MNEEMTMNSVEETKLRAGKRFLLESEDAYVEIVSGSVEAYAVTKGDVSFRRSLQRLRRGKQSSPPWTNSSRSTCSFMSWRMPSCA